MTNEEADAFVDARMQVALADERSSEMDTIEIKNEFKRDHINHSYHRRSIVNALMQPNFNAYGERPLYSKVYLGQYLEYMTGLERLRAVESEEYSDLLVPNNLPINQFYRRAEIRQRVNDSILNSFKKYLLVDNLETGRLRLGLSDTLPLKLYSFDPDDSSGLKFHQNTLKVKDTSDGTKAFIGILLRLHTRDPKLFLIDEPEAFLHPPLAFRLGQEIAKSISESDQKSRVFVATHSAHFLMGCVQTATELNIVRLEYQAGVASARILENAQIRKMMNNPLLRSARVLEGLFYRSVVVVEGDSDRAFYQEINQRLLEFKPEWGIEDCLFISAYGKDKMNEVVAAMRQVGIPTASIVDVDFFTSNGDVFDRHPKAAFYPDELFEGLKIQRKRIFNLEKKESQSDFEKKGFRMLVNSQKVAAEKLSRDMNEFGLFIVENGALESWLEHLGQSGTKKKHVWLTGVFGKMGENPTEENYVKPSDDDVWAFIYKIKQWLTEPDRKGMPE